MRKMKDLWKRRLRKEALLFVELAFKNCSDLKKTFDVFMDESSDPSGFFRDLADVVERTAVIERHIQGISYEESAVKESERRINKLREIFFLLDRPCDWDDVVQDEFSKVN